MYMYMYTDTADTVAMHAPTRASESQLSALPEEVTPTIKVFGFTSFSHIHIDL